MAYKKLLKNIRLLGTNYESMDKNSSFDNEEDLKSHLLNEYTEIDQKSIYEYKNYSSSDRLSRERFQANKQKYNFTVPKYIK